MKRLMLVTLVVIGLFNPAPGLFSFGIALPLVSSQVEYYTRPAAQGTFLEASRGGVRTVLLDPKGKPVVPLGMDLKISSPHRDMWLTRFDPGRKTFDPIVETHNGVLIWTAEEILEYHTQSDIEPGGFLPLVVIVKVIDQRRKTETYKVLFFFDAGSTTQWYDENNPTTLTVQFDNWCGWKPGDRWREPDSRFWADRVTWNRATEVSDFTLVGQEAGSENWIAKWANQLGPGNSLMARVRYEDGDGQRAETSKAPALFFLTKKAWSVPDSLPGSLMKLHRLPCDWYGMPERLRIQVEDTGLQPWLLEWVGNPAAATFIVSRAMREAIMESFPNSPGMRRLIVVGSAGFKAQGNLPLSFGVEATGDDTRILVPSTVDVSAPYYGPEAFPGGELDEEVVEPADVVRQEEPLRPEPQPMRIEPPRRLE